MGDFLKYGLIFLGGAAVGALGMKALGNEKFNFKPFASDLISRGINVKDAIVGKIETLKEDLDDIAAAAKQSAAKKTEDSTQA
ncbi:MAG: hypothetical protein IJU40_00140 [Desulfovibrionaceae bacterium]|nr:hypothetical protein [Desulfovibrionaceae bacterium]